MIGALIGGFVTGVVVIALIWVIDLWLCSRNSKSLSDYEVKSQLVVIGAIVGGVVLGFILLHGLAWMIGCALALYFGYRFLDTKVWHK